MYVNCRQASTGSLPLQRRLQAQPARINMRLQEDPPENGQPAAQVIEQVAREVLPFAARLDHPRCFAFVPSSTTWPSVLADFITRIGRHMGVKNNTNHSFWYHAGLAFSGVSDDSNRIAATAGRR